jgi:hypothetical protein
MSDGAAVLREIVDHRRQQLSDAAGRDLTRAAEAERIAPRILASLDHSPRRLELYLNFYEQLVTGPLGESRLKSVIRGRVAELTELRLAGQLGQDADPPLPSGLAPDEAALVQFMDAWAIDHQAVSPDLHAALRDHFSAAELTELYWAVAIIFASARVGATIGITAFPASPA